jgi:predicted nucleic acid-binding protein
VPGALLDTSVLISSGAMLPPSAAISVVTVGELRAGVLLARDEREREARRRRLALVRRAFLPLPVDEEVAERYGELLALARRERRVTKASDLLIVATALATGRELVTRDERQGALAERAAARGGGPGAGT